MNNDNMMKEAIRYAFLSDWVKQATHEEIIEKLVQNDERAKQLEAYENMRKEAIDYIEEKGRLKYNAQDLLNILNKVGDSNE